MSTPPPEGDRIAKVLSRRGIASRRDAERMIAEGRVTLNGRVIDSPAVNVGPKDRITVDGAPLPEEEPTRLWLYHKPAGLVTSASDEQGRATVFDQLPEDMPRVMSIGRLDLTSEGLLLLTNDGAIKRRLELPSTGWLRRYRVRINGTVEEAALNRLRLGISVDGVDYQPMDVTFDRAQGANAWLTVAIREGKNREIRRAMEAIGLVVTRLIRISYGPFQLGELEPGAVQEIARRVVRDQLGLDRTRPSLGAVTKSAAGQAADPSSSLRKQLAVRPAKGRPMRPRKEGEAGGRFGPGRIAVEDGKPTQGRFVKAEAGPRPARPGYESRKPQEGEAGPERKPRAAKPFSPRPKPSAEAADTPRAKPFVRRDGDKPFARRDRDKPVVRRDGDKPFVKRDGDRPFVKRDGDKPFAKRDGDRPFVKRDGDRPFAKRDGEKPFVKRDGGKPWARPEAEGAARKPRSFAPRDAAPEGGTDRRPEKGWTPRAPRPDGAEVGPGPGRKAFAPRGPGKPGGFKPGGPKPGGFKTGGPRGEGPQSKGTRSEGTRSGGYKSHSDRPRADHGASDRPRSEAPRGGGAPRGKSPARPRKPG